MRHSGFSAVARHIAATLLLLAPVSALHAQVVPALTTPSDLEVTEGDPGSQAVVLSFILDSVSSSDVTFEVSVQWESWRAVPDADFVDFPTRTVTIQAGQTQGSVTVQVLDDSHVEGPQSFRVVTDALAGATYAYMSGHGTTITILDDDVEDISHWVVRDDHAEIAANFPFDTIDLGANDSTDRSWYNSLDVGFTMLEPPAAGSFVYQGNARGRFHLEPGMMGAYPFRYRFCLQGTCREATATVNVVPFPEPQLADMGHSGYREVFAYGLEGRRVSTSPLVPPEQLEVPVGVDRSHLDAWDSEVGASTRAFVLPAAMPGQAAEEVVVIESDPARGGWVSAGVDANGDGRLARDESACRWLGQVCLLKLTRSDVARDWLLRVHNGSEFPIDALVDVYRIPMAGPDGTLTVTGPGKETSWPFEDAHVAWHDPTLLTNERRRGIIRLSAPDGVAVADLPVRVTRYSDTDSPAVPLVPGRVQALRLAPGTAHPRVFVDVPDGVSALSVRVGTDAPGGTPVHLVRRVAALDPSQTAIDAAPQAGEAVVSGVAGPGGTTLAVPTGALAPGRWYVVPENTATSPVALEIEATIEARPPEVRSGSYYNAARAGSGVFLYPAGEQWTGLWYTYFADGRPTWYYLQGPRATPDGGWRSPIYRATWDGSSRTLTAVGEASITPVGDDAFTFSYLLDGVAGSQPMQPLGRGCPASGGTAVDASSTWFDPARAGTGYSVQFWEDYEYVAAFLYDEQGVPMFLAAERNGFGGDDAVLTLQRLTGACPTCAWSASERVDVGALSRRFAGDALSAIDVDAVWQDGNPPYWRPPQSALSTTDTVQLLGGPGTTQGCAP